MIVFSNTTPLIALAVAAMQANGIYYHASLVEKLVNEAGEARRVR